MMHGKVGLFVLSWYYVPWDECSHAMIVYLEFASLSLVELNPSLKYLRDRDSFLFPLIIQKF